MGRVRADLGLTASQFTDLVERSSLDLLRFFANRTFNAQIAADLTAETLAEAYAHRARFDPELGDCRAWVFGIARHQLAHFARRRRVETSARSRLGVRAFSLPDSDIERVEELIDSAPLRDAVRSGLRALSIEQRQAIELRVLGGLEYREISARLQCTEKVARARVSRGLRRIASALSLTGSTSEPREIG